MRRTAAIGTVLVLLIWNAGQAQTPEAANDDEQTSTRIRALSTRLKFSEDDARDKRRYYDELEDVTRQVHTEVDQFVQRAVRIDAQSSQVEGRLRRILSAHTPEPLYGDLPFAKVADLRFGRSLVIAYTIVRPPHHDVATIRAYRSDGNRFELVTQAGTDFEGYNMFKRELRSPIAGELWLMAWGQAHAANGSLKRFRLYGFDGENFRTIWNPEDIWNATLRFTAQGFAIDRETTDPPYHATDQYAITINGAFKVN